MKIGILGTGMVGKTLAAKLASLDHDVMLGTRDPSATSTRASDGFPGWHGQHPTVKLGTFADTARHGEALINALSGQATLDGLHAAGDDNLAGKILLDISNPLDFSRGMPPSLSVCNTDSLGEQIQRAFPRTKVVKTLNTVNANLMVAPGQLADGEHTMFVSGDDATAKVVVAGHLKEWFGWRDVLDLGDITTARGTEMYLPLWVRLWGSLKTPMFSVRVVR